MLNLLELLLRRLHRKESINRYKHCQRKTIDFSRIHYFDTCGVFAHHNK